MNPVALPALETGFTSASPTSTQSVAPTATPTNPEPFPTGQAMAITASVTVATMGLFVYFKKSRNNAVG
jgi:hypothetical protein